MSEFQQFLLGRLEELNCTAAELAAASGLSPAVISRYLHGERTPPANGKSAQQLARGLAALSETSQESALTQVQHALAGITAGYDTAIGNLGQLVDALGVTRNELARALNFDPSYISRILSGNRHPADLAEFLSETSRYLAHRFAGTQRAQVIVDLCDAGHAGGAGAAAADMGDTDAGSANARGIDTQSEAELAQAILAWLGSNAKPPADNLSHFLEALDTFDLDDFIRAIHFDEMQVPTAPFQLPTRKVYTGLDEMMACELDFLKAVVLAKAKDDVVMYSDMPLEEMAADAEFARKWMYGMALMLKKGLHLHMIHDANRPLREMMLGLEGWIPMYMTGQISPYYFPNSQCDVFCHILKVAGSVAMQGEAIAGCQAEGRYVLVKGRDEVRYLRRRAERMLQRARPLMRIVTAANAGDLEGIRRNFAAARGQLRLIAGALPLGAMPAGLLGRVLERAGMDEDLRGRICAHARIEAIWLRELLESGETVLEVPGLDEGEFTRYPTMLDLSGLFLEEGVACTFAEYQEHLEALRILAGQYPDCTLVVDRASAFRNLQILVRAGSCALVSKAKGPVVHFAIEHPKMVDAFERYTTPIRDPA